MLTLPAVHEKRYADDCCHLSLCVMCAAQQTLLLLHASDKQELSPGSLQAFYQGIPVVGMLVQKDQLPMLTEWWQS